MDVICTICWDALDSGSIYATTCGHIFHKQCICPWTMRNHCCPECRHEPTIPLRVINFTWQEQLETQEMHSLDTEDDATSSSELHNQPSLWKTVSTEDMFRCSGDSERNTAEMTEVAPESSPGSQKRLDEAEQQSQQSDGCGVCSRFHYLLEKSIKLRNTINEYEKAKRMPSSPAASEQLKQAIYSGPEAKRPR